jgi:pimeloyl-ACP methyl ester carboxylesterase
MRVLSTGLISAAVAIAIPGAVRAEAPPYTAQPRPITLSTPSGDVQGTLEAPQALSCSPVVLIIAGSGPTDRDGNSAALPTPNNSLKMLAQALAEAGIASVRYDKRGIGASKFAAQDEAQLRFETDSGDAAAWIRQLRQEGHYASVTVLGHSEGSLIGMIAAREAGADAYISVSGPAQGASAILRHQLAGKLPPALAKENETILSALEHGQQPGTVPPELAALYRPSVQPYLISWFNYVPEREFAKLKVPSLIVQGTTDIQVDTSQAELLKTANPAARLAIVPGMNHVLKLVPSDLPQQYASYGNPALPLAPAFTSAVTSFIRTVPVHRCQ